MAAGNTYFLRSMCVIYFLWTMSHLNFLSRTNFVFAPSSSCNRFLRLSATHGSMGSKMKVPKTWNWVKSRTHRTQLRREKNCLTVPMAYCWPAGSSYSSMRYLVTQSFSLLDSKTASLAPSFSILHWISSSFQDPEILNNQMSENISHLVYSLSWWSSTDDMLPHRDPSHHQHSTCSQRSPYRYSPSSLAYSGPGSVPTWQNIM